MIIWYKYNLCGISSTDNNILKSHFSNIHNKTFPHVEMPMSVITDLEEICHLGNYKTGKSNYNPRRSALIPIPVKKIKMWNHQQMIAMIKATSNVKVMIGLMSMLGLSVRL